MIENNRNKQILDQIAPDNVIAMSHISRKVSPSKEHSLVEVSGIFNGIKDQAENQDEGDSGGKGQRNREDGGDEGHLIVEAVEPFLERNFTAEGVSSFL